MWHHRVHGRPASGYSRRGSTRTVTSAPIGSGQFGLLGEVEAAHQRAKDLLTEHREHLGTISEVLVKRETIEKEEFEGLLAGKTEEEVFGSEAPPPPGPPVPGEPAMVAMVAALREDLA